MSATLDERLTALEGHWTKFFNGSVVCVSVDPTPELGLHVFSWPAVKTEQDLEVLVTEVERLRKLPHGAEVRKP